MLRTSCLQVLGSDLAKELLQVKLTAILCILTRAFGIPELNPTETFLLGRIWTISAPELSLRALAAVNGRRGVCPKIIVTLDICCLRCPLACKQKGILVYSWALIRKATVVQALA